MKIKIKDQRANERFTIHGLIKFSCDGLENVFNGKLVNCSEDGICFDSRTEMLPGTAVFISEIEDSKYFRAEVVWCNKIDQSESDSFIIGARYSDVD